MDVALDPVRPVGEVVVLHVDQWRRPSGLEIGRLRTGTLRRTRIEHRQPLPVGARHAGATCWIDLLVGSGTAVVGRGCAQACQCIQVGEVLLAATVERDVCVAATGSVLGSAQGRGRRAWVDFAIGMAFVNGSVPEAALSPGPGGAAREHPAQWIDADVGLAHRVHRIDHGWGFKDDSSAVRGHCHPGSRRDKHRDERDDAEHGRQNASPNHVDPP